MLWLDLISEWSLKSCSWGAGLYHLKITVSYYTPVRKYKAMNRNPGKPGILSFKVAYEKSRIDKAQPQGCHCLVVLKRTKQITS